MYDVTKTETHLPANSWHDPSVPACWRVPGYMEAFFETRTFGGYCEA